MIVKTALSQKTAQAQNRIGDLQGLTAASASAAGALLLLCPRIRLVGSAPGLS